MTLVLAEHDGPVDSRLPGDTELVGTVVGVVKKTGAALVQTGQGNQYLVDGLTAAPGELITATIGKATAIGSPDASPLLGASILSPGQEAGSLLTVGVGSNGKLVTLQPGSGTGLLGGLGSSGTGATGAVGGVVSGVTGTLAGVTGGDGGGNGGLVSGVTGTVGQVVGGATGGATGDGDGTGGLVSGVTGAVGGLLGGHPPAGGTD